jgi:hypothetical protein
VKTDCNDFCHGDPGGTRQGNLILRGKTYSVRLIHPADLRAHAGCSEVVRTVKTGDRKQARLLLRRVQEVAERLFFCARIGSVDKGKLIAALEKLR